MKDKQLMEKEDNVGHFTIAMNQINSDVIVILGKNVYFIRLLLSHILERIDLSSDKMFLNCQLLRNFDR